MSFVLQQQFDLLSNTAISSLPLCFTAINGISKLALNFYAPTSLRMRELRAVPVPIRTVMGVTSFTRSHERKSRGFVWVQPKHAGMIRENHGELPLWASDLLSVGIHYFAGVVDDAEEVLENINSLHSAHYKQTSHYHSYKSFVPTFLHDPRPRSVLSSPLSGETVKVPQIYQR